VGAATFFSSQGRAAHASGSGDGGPCSVAPEVSAVCHNSGCFVEGTYSTVEPSAMCANGILTSFTFNLWDNVTRDGSGQTTGPSMASVFYRQINQCDYTYDQGYGEVTTAMFKCTGNLGSATVAAADPVPLYSGVTATETVNLTWTGVGDIGSNMGDKQVRMGGFTTITKFKGENRQAMLSGTVSDGTTTYNVAATSDITSTQIGSIQVVQS
jgi:hypothetical protein